MSARVEAAAKAASKDAAEPNWYLETERFRDTWRIRTEAALTGADQIMFSEAAIERAAKAGFESVSGLMGFPGPFETAPEPLQETYRVVARAVIAALRDET